MMMFLFLPFLLLVAVLVLVWALHGGERSLPMAGCMMGHGDMGHEARSEAPVDILRERYARDAITREEYEEMRRVLGA